MKIVPRTSFVRSSTRTIESLVTPRRRGASLFFPDIFSWEKKTKIRISRSHPSSIVRFTLTRKNVTPYVRNDRQSCVYFTFASNSDRPWCFLCSYINQIHVWIVQNLGFQSTWKIRFSTPLVLVYSFGRNSRTLKQKTNEFLSMILRGVSMRFSNGDIRKEENRWHCIKYANEKKIMQEVL